MRGRVVLAAQHMRADRAERLRAQGRDGTTIRVRCIRIDLVLLRREQRRHISVHGGDDGRPAGGIEVAVEVDPPVAFVDRQGAVVALLLLPWGDPVRIQPGLGPRDQAAHLVVRQADGLVDEQLLGRGRALGADLDAHTVEQGDDHGDGRGAQRAGSERLLAPPGTSPAPDRRPGWCAVPSRSPTFTSRDASPVVVPVIVAISCAALRNPCSFASESAPSSARDSSRRRRRPRRASLRTADAAARAPPSPPQPECGTAARVLRRTPHRIDTLQRLVRGGDVRS